MKHIPTGLSVWIDGRDQHQNKRVAKRILTARVNAHNLEKKENAHGNNRRQQLGSGTRGDKVRTYNFIESRVTDHRLGKKTRQLKEVMKGRFDLLLE